MDALPPLPESLRDGAAIETPVAVVDLGVVRRNAEGAAAYAARHGLTWRPHVKTHKSLGIARIQLEAGARGLTVATAREAEVMAEVCDDLLFAYPPVSPRTLDRLLNLPERVRLAVALDSAECLQGLARAFSGAGRMARVVVEADVGLGRTGLGVPEEVVELARKVDSLPGVGFEGLLFYPGHIRLPAEEQDGPLEELAERVEELLEVLERVGLPPSTVSGGSSPTLWRSHEIPGLTEIRAGMCIYHDRDLVKLGVARDLSDCAYTVLSTVVSVPGPDRFVLDAGSKALSKEVLPSGGEGYGLMPERGGLLVSALSEEHAVVRVPPGSEMPRVGERLRVVPNHVCVSVNLQEGFVALDGEDWELWPVDARGRAGST